MSRTLRWGICDVVGLKGRGCEAYSVNDRFMSDRHPVSIEINELVQCSFPVPNRHSPLLRYISETQRQELADSLIMQEGTTTLDDFTQAVVQRLNRIAGEDPLADGRQCKPLPARRNLVGERPVPTPAPAGRNR
jgi:hypothetical protein